MERFIGENIKKIRIKAGYTQEKLAEKIDVSLSVISRLETGRTMVSVEKLMKIAHVLNVPVAVFFNEPEVTQDLSTPQKYVPQLAESSAQYSPDKDVSGKEISYKDISDEELFHIIRQLPDKSKDFLKKTLLCYLETF